MAAGKNEIIETCKNSELPKRLSDWVLQGRVVESSIVNIVCLVKHQFPRKVNGKWRAKNELKLNAVLEWRSPISLPSIILLFRDFVAKSKNKIYSYDSP